MVDRWITVTFPDASVRAELSEDVARGLMGRTSLAEGQGMLFDMRTNAIHRFWMKGVLMPLDIVFIYGGVITGIIESAPAGDETGRFGSGRYVLEVAGGWCRKRGVRVGQRVEFS